MMLAKLLSLSVAYWPWLVFALLTAPLLYLRYRRGLSRFNGPWLASFSDLWKIWSMYLNWHKRIPFIEVHQEYGHIVRIGPDHLSFGDPQAIRDIYGPGKNWQKTNAYRVAAAVSNGVVTPSLFSGIDETWHNNLRRAVNQAFALSTLVQYEPYVDSTVKVFLEELGRRYADKEGPEGVINFSRWLQFYAFDVIGELTYGARVGFLDSGSDVDGIIAFLRKFLEYQGLIGHMPSLDEFLIKNPVRLWLSRHGWIDTTTPVVPYALKQQAEREAKFQEKRSTSDPEPLLDKFIRARNDQPNVVTNKEVLGLGLSMIFAGSETTAITLSALFYNLLRNTRCYRELQAEVDSKLSPMARDATTYRTAFSESQKLPYLDACIKETFRIHPAAQFNPERVVPYSGATICGSWVPGGTIVSCNAWVLHRNQQVFGEDVETYRPERWLGDETKVKEMNRTLFQFGSGSHMCIGKNISMMEMYKVVPSLLRTYKISLANPEKEWTLTNASFVMITDFDVRIERRI